MIGPKLTLNLANLFNQSNLDQYVAYLKSTSLSDASLKRKLSSLASFQKFLVKKNIIESLPQIKLNLRSKIYNLKSHFLRSTIDNLRSKSIATYLTIASLLIISSGIGYTLYRQAITRAKINLAYTTASKPIYADRYLSFQGHLTDSSGNPITSETDILFELFNNPDVGVGTTLYTSASGNSQTVTFENEENGVFSVTIGKSHGTTIPDNVFTQNSAVYLQITAGNETMSPRQSIATVAYAINAESLQGLPPSASGLKDTMLVIDGSGNLNLGESNPAIFASSTAPNSVLRIEGQAVLIKATDTYGGNIEINPDANGIIKLTTEGSGSTAVGGFINATNANLSTGNLYNATIGNNNRGYNFISFNNFNSGIGNTQLSTRFSVDASGNTFIGGTLSPATISIGNTILTSSAVELNYLDGTLTTAGSVIYGNGSNLSNTDVGVSGEILMSNATGTPVWINASSAGIGTTYAAGNGLTLSSGVFKLGGNLTENTSIGTSSFSLSFLGLGGTQSLFVASSGNVGIGTTDPLQNLSVVGNGSFSTSLSVGTSLTVGSNLSVGNSLSVTGRSTFDQNVFVNAGGIGVTGNSVFSTGVTAAVLSVIGNGSIGGTLAVTGRSTFDQNVFVNAGGIGVTGNSVFSENVTVGGTLQSGSINLTNTSIGGSNIAAFLSGTSGLIGYLDTTAWDKNASDDYASWNLQSNSAGTTAILTGNTVNFVNGIGISLSQTGSSITINNTSIGTTYAAGNGLTLSSDVFELGGAITENTRLNIGSTEVLYLQYTTGNIGIGTTEPGAKLDISTSTSGVQTYLRLTNTGAFSGGEPTIDFYNSAGEITTAQIGSFPGAGYNVSVLRFSVADSSQNLQERMRIDTSGNVGIGTTDPLQNLSVVGNGSFSTSLSVGTSLTVGSNLSVGNSLSVTGRSTFDQNVFVNAGGIGVTGNSVFSENVTVGGTLQSGSINLTNTSIGGSNIAAFLSGTSGLIGYLDTTAWDKNASDDYASWNLQSNSADTTAILTGNTVNFVNGIGVSLVQSGSTITINDTGIGTTYAAGNGLTLSSDVFELGGAITENTRLNIGSTEVLYLQYTTGNIGIGTTEPTEKLETTGTIRINTTNTTGILAFGNHNEGAGYYDTGLFRGTLGGVASGNYLNVVGYAGIAFNSSAAAMGSQTTRMYIDGTSGNIGIGTTGPSAPLDFGTFGVGQTTGQTILTYHNGNYRGGIGSDYGTSGGTRIFSPTTDPIAIFGGVSVSDGTTFVEKVRIDKDGNVGIGTISPVSRLSFGNTSSTNRRIALWEDPSGSDFYGIGLNDGGSTVSISTNNTAQLSILSSGNVGIGTTNPNNFKLQVAGSVGPQAPDLYDLGSSANHWNAVYANTFVGAMAPFGFTQGPVVFGGTAGALTQDNDLFWDNTSKRLGIGTTNPTHKLEIIGDASVSTNLDIGGSLTGNGLLNQTFSNIINNGGFESGSNSSWIGAGVGTTQYSHSGNYSLSVNNGTSHCNEYSYQDYDVKPNTVYSLTGWVKTIGETANSAIWISEGVGAGCTQWGRASTSSITGTTDWTQRSVESWNSGTCTKIRVGFTKQYCDVSGQSYFDDLMLTEGSSPKSYYAKPIVDSSTNSQSIMGGNVGIGTTGPGYKLEVSGTAKATSIQLGSSVGPIRENWWEYGIDGGNGAGIDWHTHTTGSVDYDARTYREGGDNGNFQIFNVGAGALLLGAGGSPGQLTILSGGNVGIGTIAPNAKLQIAGTRSNTINNTTDIAAIGGDDVYTRFGTLAGSPNYGSWMQVSNDAGTALPLLLNPVGGNVGIGTANPLNELDVAGNIGLVNDNGLIKLTGSTTYQAGSYNFGSQTQIYYPSATGNGDGSKYATAGSISIQAQTLTWGGPTNVLGAQVYLEGGKSPNAGQVAGNLLLNYSNGGNVGIGTTNPSQKLEVLGDIRLSGVLEQGTQTAYPNAMWSAAGNTTGAIIIKLPGNTGNYGMVYMEIDVYEYGPESVTTYIIGGHNWNNSWYQYGNRTIGISNKKIRLAVKDGQYAVVIGDNTSVWSYGHVVLSKITNGNYYAGTIDLGGTYSVYQDSNAESYTWISADLNNKVAFASGTTNYVPKFTSSNSFGNSQIFDDGTSVGIGTASPNSLLDVRGRINTYEIAFRNSGGGDDSDPYRMRKYQTVANTNELQIQLNDDADERLAIYGNSCVGYSCGEYSGNLYHYFSVNGNAYHAGSLTIAGTGTVINISNAGASTDISLQNGETIDNDSDGRINFGGSSPYLSLGGTTFLTPGRLFQAANGSAGGPAYSFQADTDSGMYSASDGVLRLATNSVDRVTILADGNVGIGTVSPDAKLKIIGSRTSYTSSNGSYTGGGKGHPPWGGIWAGYSSIAGAGLGDVTYQAGTAGGLSYGGPGDYVAGGGAGLSSFGGDGGYYAEGGAGIYAKGGANGTWYSGNYGIARAPAGYFDGDMFVMSGKVGIGTISPDSTLDVNGPISVYEGAATSGYPIFIKQTSVNQYLSIESTGSYEAMTRYYNPTAGNWYTGIRSGDDAGAYHIFSSTYGADTFRISTGGAVYAPVSVTSPNFFGNATSASYQSATGNSNDWVQAFQQTPAHATSFREMSAGGPAGTWWLLQNLRHSNGSSYWGTQVAWGWEDNANQMYTRNVQGNNFGAWVKYFNSGNDGAGSGLDADLLEGLQGTAYLKDDGWNTYPGQDANTQPVMSSDFTYANNAPYSGDLIRFGGGSYSLQLNSAYSGGDGLSFRTFNGDAGAWNGWNTVLHSDNYRSYSDFSGYVYGSELWTRDNLYLGYMGNWMSNLFNQNVRTDSEPTFYGLILSTALHGANRTVDWADINAGLYSGTNYYAYRSMCVNNNSGTCDSSNGIVFGLDNDSAFTNLPSSGDSYFLGELGIGTQYPTNKLEVRQDIYTDMQYGYPYDTSQIQIRGASNPNRMLQMGYDTSHNYGWIRANEAYVNSTLLVVQPFGNVGIGNWANVYKLEVQGDGVFRGSVYSSTYGWLSDERLKENIQPIANSLEALMQINGKSFDWRKDEFPDKGLPGGLQYGMIAQDVEKVLPNLVSTMKDGYKTINYSSFIPFIIESIKEQQGQIASISGQLAGVSLTPDGQINVDYNVSPEVLASLGYEGAKNEIESATYSLTDTLGATVTRIAQFSEVASAKIKVGLISAQNIIADNAVIKNLRSEKLTSDQLISPLADVGSLKAATATISGTLTAQDIQTTQLTADTIITQDLSSLRSTIDDLRSNTATVSTLYADQIISKEGSFGDIMASKISSLRDELKAIVASNLNQDSENDATPSAILAESENWSIAVATDSATITGNLSLTDSLIIGAQLMVNGDSQFSNAFVSGSFTAGQIAISGNSISTLNTALYIQPSNTGSIHLMGDTLVISDNGDVIINGDLAITGSLFGNLITANEIATQKLTAAQIYSDRINIATDSASVLATIDISTTSPNSTESGSLIIASESQIPQATNSAQLTSNATAGTTTLPAGKTDLIISTNKLTPNSIVYLTPMGSTNNQVLYVKNKVVTPTTETTLSESYFTISIDQPLTQDVGVNWWIIN